MFSATSKASTPQIITLTTSYTNFNFNRNVIFQYWVLSVPSFYIEFDNIEYFYTTPGPIGFQNTRKSGEIVTIAANTTFGIRVNFSTIQIKYIIIEV